MLICPKCKAEYEYDIKYCNVCGKKIKSPISEKSMTDKIVKWTCIIVILVVFTSLTSFALLTTPLKNDIASKVNSIFSHEDKLNPKEELASKGIKALQNYLKNPESLQVHQIGYWEQSDNKTPWVTIDASAQNGLGGMNRENYDITENNEFEPAGYWDEENGVLIVKSDLNMLEVSEKLNVDRIMKHVKD